MDKIKQWALILSLISIISGLILAVVPYSTHKKIFKTVISVIMIYSALQPLIGIKGVNFNIDDYLKDNYDTSCEMDKYALRAMISSAERAVEDLLSEKAESAGLNLIFDCRCYENNGEIKIERIYISPPVDETLKGEVDNIIESTGLDKHLITYIGDSYE